MSLMRELPILSAVGGSSEHTEKKGKDKQAALHAPWCKLARRLS